MTGINYKVPWTQETLLAIFDRLLTPLDYESLGNDIGLRCSFAVIFGEDSGLRSISAKDDVKKAQIIRTSRPDVFDGEFHNGWVPSQHLMVGSLNKSGFQKRRYLFVGPKNSNGIESCTIAFQYKFGKKIYKKRMTCYRIALTKAAWIIAYEYYQALASRVNLGDISSTTSMYQRNKSFALYTEACNMTDYLLALYSLEDIRRTLIKSIVDEQIPNQVLSAKVKEVSSHIQKIEGSMQ